MKQFKFKFYLNMDKTQTKEITLKSPFEGNPQLYNYVQDHLHEALLPYNCIVAPNKKFALVQDEYTDNGEWWDIEEVIDTGDCDADVTNPDYETETEPYLKVQAFLEFTRRVIMWEYPGIVPQQNQETDEEKAGVDAIVALQKFVGIDEPRDLALKNWRNMNATTKRLTLNAYKMLRSPTEGNDE